MNKVSRDFAVEVRNGIVENIGRSYVEQPEVKWNRKGIKWFDDSVLLKKKSIA